MNEPMILYEPGDIPVRYPHFTEQETDVYFINAYVDLHLLSILLVSLTWDGIVPFG